MERYAHDVSPSSPLKAAGCRRVADEQHAVEQGRPRLAPAVPALDVPGDVEQFVDVARAARRLEPRSQDGSAPREAEIKERNRRAQSCKVGGVVALRRIANRVLANA